MKYNIYHGQNKTVSSFYIPPKVPKIYSNNFNQRLILGYILY